MRKFFFFAPMLLLMAACSNDQPESPQGGNSNSIPEVNDYSTVTSEELTAAASTRAFDFALLKGIANDNKGENIVVSPFSAQFALSMLANCVDKASATQIVNALGCDNLSALNSFNGKCLNSLTTLDSKTDISIANSLWYSNTLTLSSDFANLLTGTYGADQFARDFNNNIAGEINSWCADKTHGLIKDIIDKTDDGKLAMLVNALYFKSEWTEPFKEDNTEIRPFNGESGTSIINMMYSKEKMPYLAGENYQAVKLSFGNGTFATTFILPEEDTTIDDFIDGFDYTTFTNSAFKTAEVNLALPKCKLMPEKYNLRETLKAMGITNIFNGAISTMFTEREPVSTKIDQKSTIEFSEKGAEASSVTSIGMDGACPGLDFDYVSVTFNRPYLFFLTETKSGICLMAGKVADIPSVE